MGAPEEATNMEANTEPADDRTKQENYILLHYTTPISPAPEEATNTEANTAPADDIRSSMPREKKHQYRIYQQSHIRVKYLIDLKKTKKKKKARFTKKKKKKKKKS